MEGHLGHMPEPDNPSWVFPGDIIHLDAPDDYTTFHDQSNDMTPPKDDNIRRDIWPMMRRYGRTRVIHLIG